MLISKIGTLTQSRMGLSRVIFRSEGPIRGQYVFFISY